MAMSLFENHAVKFKADLLSAYVKMCVEDMTAVNEQAKTKLQAERDALKAKRSGFLGRLRSALDFNYRHKFGKAERGIADQEECIDAWTQRYFFLTAMGPDAEVPLSQRDFDFFFPGGLFKIILAHYAKVASAAQGTPVEASEATTEEPNS
jgi:hypothetical protein